MRTKEQIFIRKQKTAFIASVDEDGFPNMKAMFAPRKIEGNCFYFTTNTSSMRAQQFLKNPRASIYFYNRGRFRYEGIMLTGSMEVLLDEEIKVTGVQTCALSDLGNLAYRGQYVLQTGRDRSRLLCTEIHSD